MLQNAKIKVVIDYAFSSASLILPDILGRLGIEVVSLNAYLSAQRVTKTADDFQGALDRLSTIVVTLKADAGFLIDTGAEKAFIIDEKGNRIPNENALLLIANLMMRDMKSGSIGVPVNVSGLIERLAKSRTTCRCAACAPRRAMWRKPAASRASNLWAMGSAVLFSRNSKATMTRCSPS